MKQIQGHDHRRSWLARAVALTAVLVWPLEARAEGPGEAAASLMGIVIVLVLLGALGLGVGAFSLTVCHIFRQRATTSFRVLCARPGWSLLAGVVVTLLGLSLLALLNGVGPLQLAILLAYLGGLVLFAIAIAVRFAGRVIEPSTLDDELPEARLLLKGGLLLLAINVVPLVGTLLFFGILFAAVGATLLGYFAKLGGRLRPALAATPGPLPTATAEPGAG